MSLVALTVQRGYHMRTSLLLNGYRHRLRVLRPDYYRLPQLQCFSMEFLLLLVACPMPKPENTAQLLLIAASLLWHTFSYQLRPQG